MRDLSGCTFNRYSVVDYSHMGNNYVSYWNCICVCGNKRKVSSLSLVHGKSKSCGCYATEVRKTTRYKHGHSSGRKGTTEFYCWQGIKARCYNENTKYYKNYGARGIKVCDRWLHSFENFLKDMGNRPSKQYSLDRIDNDGHYELNNCRWATQWQQNRNKRTNRWIEFNGQRMILNDWAAYFGVKVCPFTRMIDRDGEEKAIIYHKLKFNK